MPEKFLLEDVETGTKVELPVDYQVILNTPANGTIEINGKNYRKVGKKGSVLKGPVKHINRNVGPLERVSWAAGVHSDQVDETREFVKDVHPGIEVRNNGDLEFGCRAARAAWLRSQNMRDNDGGYSDG